MHFIEKYDVMFPSDRKCTNIVGIDTGVINVM